MFYNFRVTESSEPPNNNNNNSLNSSQLSASLDSNNCDTSKHGNTNNLFDINKIFFFIYIFIKLGNESFPNSEALTITNSTPVLSKTQKSPLIEPSEVLVSQSSVLKAEPVITHLGMQYLLINGTCAFVYANNIIVYHRKITKK